MPCVQGRWGFDDARDSLARRVIAPRTHAERSALLLSHMGLIHSVARRFSRQLRRFYEYEDLVAIGQEALWRATETWDPDRAASFLTYGHKALIHSFLEVRKHWNRPKRQAAYMSISIEAVEAASEKHDCPPLFVLRSPLPDPETLAHLAEERCLLQREYRHLELRDRHLLGARFEEGVTLDEFGKQIGVTRERVRQLELRALGRLRDRLEPVLEGLRDAPSPVSLRSARGMTERTLRKVARQKALT